MVGSSMTSLEAPFSDVPPAVGASAEAGPCPLPIVAKELPIGGAAWHVCSSSGVGTVEILLENSVAR